MDRSLIATSKFLSLVLRHRPESIGIELDPGGWVGVDDLISAASQRGRHLSRELIRRVVEENDKQRFALSDDGLRIRANQGHSIRAVDLALEPMEPPLTLYHGTVAKFLSSIRQHGLRKRSRNHVHLSSDVATARKVGMRRGEPVVLAIDSAAMHRDGMVFYRSANGVWLTESVPVEFIRFEVDLP